VPRSARARRTGAPGRTSTRGDDRGESRSQWRFDNVDARIKLHRLSRGHGGAWHGGTRSADPIASLVAHAPRPCHMRSRQGREAALLAIAVALGSFACGSDASSIASADSALRRPTARASAIRSRRQTARTTDSASDAADSGVVSDGGGGGDTLDSDAGRRARARGRHEPAPEPTIPPPARH